MTLVAAFTDLREQLERLRELVIGLHTTVLEDRPLEGETALVERFGNATDDVRGYLEAALAAAEDGRRAVDGHHDLELARRSLITCNEQLYRFLMTFSSDLFSYERIAALDRLGRGRGGEWMAWAGVVGDTLNRCQERVNQVNKMLLQCWQEVAERTEMTSVSIRTGNVRQEFLVHDGQRATRKRIL